MAASRTGSGGSPTRGPKGSRQRRLALTTVTLAGAVACGGPTPPASGPAPLARVESAELGPCPPPLAFGSSPRPRGIRVVNRTGEPVMVFLDRCRGHDRVVDVAAGQTRLARLPERLVQTHGGLTFHTFLKETVRYHSGVTLPVDTVAILELELGPAEEGEACDPVVYVDGARWERPVSEIPGVIREVRVREPSRPGQCREYLFETR